MSLDPRLVPPRLEADFRKSATAADTAPAVADTPDKKPPRPRKASPK